MGDHDQAGKPKAVEPAVVHLDAGSAAVTESPLPPVSAVHAVAPAEVPSLDLPDGTMLWIDHYGPHPAIVLRKTNHGPFQVAHGTSKEHPEIPARGVPVEHVDPDSRAGRALGLTYRTYFFPKSFVFLSDPARIVKRCGRDVDLLLLIRRLTSR